MTKMRHDTDESFQNSVLSVQIVQRLARRNLRDELGERVRSRSADNESRMIAPRIRPSSRAKMTLRAENSARFRSWGN
jgi:hypothetical protein